MTIMEALERAKLMRKAKEETAVHRRVERQQVLVEEPAEPLILQDTLSSESGAGPEEFAALERVDFDAAIGEAHHVLVQDQATDAAARADAAYRMLRGRVLNRIRTSNWSCVGISSPGPGEGKTVTTLNLAICIAREKQRPVYLLDLDMRNPSVLAYVGVRPPIGLSRYFSDGLSADQVLFETNMPGLIVGGNREPVANASELLATSRLAQLLAYIRRRSPDALIIIDLPPVMSTDEALVVAPKVDGMLLVVSEGITRRDQLRRCTDMLSDFPVAGIIMNRSSEGLGRKYYGGY